MADYASHRRQALHNEATARFLLPLHHDWAVTATFYAALHHFESWLFSRPEKHSETVSLGGVPVHAWRKNYLQRHLPNAYQAYSFLYQRSQEARYLHGLGTNAAPVPAQSLVDAAKAKFCLDNKLHDFKAAIRTELADFLHTLMLQPSTFQLVLSAFPNRKALNTASQKQIQAKLAPPVAVELISALTKAGAPPSP